MTNTALNWDENGTPISTRFDDPYYSKRDGRAESDHVFIKGNALPSRWHEPLTIAELGFGTGLNMLETSRQWQKSGGEHLHFISFEQYPLNRDDMHQALKSWPDLAEQTSALLDQWVITEGENKLQIAGVDVTLMIGDANTSITELEPTVDAWYLDGFSPAKNPELWNETILSQVGRTTVAGGTFATYTAAGWVRQNLTNAGFEVDRVRGFAHKRHMSIGVKL